jgi:hypothetical protein
MEAEIPLVGQIGGASGRYVYGVTFVNPNLLFWPMEFPRPEPDQPLSLSLVLEKTAVHQRNIWPKAFSSFQARGRAGFEAVTS